jgi:PD-(D/E)XK nuclease superfamily
MHAAWAAFYDALAGGYRDDNKRWCRFDSLPENPFGAFDYTKATPLMHARYAFLHDLKIEGAELPLTLESTERRSVERGLALVEAYFHRWRNEPFENIINPQSGEPYTEIGFAIPIASYDGYDVVLVGRIDRLMRNRSTGRPVVWEGKTTTQALSMYKKQVKPNHQITTYFLAAKQYMPEIFEAVWDCVFVSDRKPDLKKALEDPFMAWGVDSTKDFDRQFTLRSQSDIVELKTDLRMTVEDYCHKLLGPEKRWRRNAPFACSVYGGCQFRDVCSMNHAGGKQILSSFFEQKRWEPWKGITSEDKSGQ